MSYSTRDEIPLRELARRSGDGIEVALIWNPANDELTVCVANEGRDSYFELTPEPGQALDCFYHPYAYAASDVELFQLDAIRS